MCKILVVSDVHGRLRDLRWLLNNETADAMFYLGDGLYDLNAALELRKEPSSSAGSTEPLPVTIPSQNSIPDRSIQTGCSVYVP